MKKFLLLSGILFFFSLQGNTQIVAKNIKLPCDPYTLNVAEGFNVTVIPACWTTQLVTATADKISFVASASYQTATPQEGTDFVMFSSFTSTGGGAGAEERLISPAIVTIGTPSVNLEFYWFESGNTSYTNITEGVQVEWSSDGTTWNNSNFYPRYVSTASTNGAWVKKAITLPAGAGGIPTLYISFKFHSAYGYNCYLDNVQVKPTPTCIEPTGLTMSVITASTATLSWTASITVPANGYDIYFSTSSVPPTAGTTPSGSVAAGVTTINLTNLTPSSTYYAWVRSICSSSDKSVWGGPVTFNTLCGIISAFPWTENFDGMTTIGNSILPNCWLGTSPTGTPWNSGNAASITYNDPCSAPNYVYVGYSPSGVDKFLITPGFALTAAVSYDFRFNWAGDGYAGWTGDVMVNSTQSGIGATALGASFVVAATTTTATCSQVTRSFIPTTTGTWYFMIRVNNTGVPWDLGFDDFMMLPTPACIEPTALTMSAITATSATVAWTAPASPPANGYDIYYSTSSIPPVAGTTPSASVAAGVTTYNLTALTPSTVYYVWVRSVCSSSDKSLWGGPSTFPTLCGNITTLPWTENFDAMTTIGNNILPTCWLATSGTGTPWYSGNAASITYSDPCSAPNYVYVYYIPATTDKFLITPGFSLTAATSYDFSFSWVGDGYGGWTGDVMNNTTQSGAGATAMGASFVVGATTTTNSCTQVKRTFVPTATGTYYFMVRVNNTSVPWDLGFDNFKLELTPTCIEPTALGISLITSNSATLNWTASVTPPANGYDIYFSTSATPPTSGTTPSGSVSAGITTFTMNGLLPNTLYNAWVRSVCSSSDKSSWGGPVTFTTACMSVAVFPFTESFDGITFPPNCWLTQKTAGTGTPGIWDRQTAGTSPATTPHSGAAMARYNAYSLSSGTKGILVTPLLTMLTDQFTVQFWMYRDNGYTTNADLVNVYYNTSASTTGATLLGTVNRYYMSSPPEVTANQWYQYVFNVPAGTSGDAYIVFEAVSAFGNNMFIDDVTISGPPCPAPTTLAATNITTTAADLGWTSVASLWEYQYGLAGYTPTPSGTATAVNPIHITGLTANTTYDFYVRGNCSGTYSPWSGPATFTTHALPPVVVTLAATGIGSTGATLNGTVNGNGATTAVSFDYGLTATYGTNVPGVPPSVSGTAPIASLITLSGLMPNTTYHFRINGSNSSGLMNGNDLTFTTNTAAPLVVTDPASGITTTGATLNGTVTANNSTTTVSFDWGTSISYGNSVPAIPPIVNGIAPTGVLATLTGLLTTTTYHYRCVGVNIAGTTFGSDQTFTTGCPPTGPAGAITGPTNVCCGATGVVYSTPTIVNASGYLWALPPGAVITAGVNTTTITVTFGCTTGNITVQGMGACGNGALSSLPITMNPLPVPTITGTASACQGSVTNVFSTQPGMTGYTWAVSAGGTITAGGGTNSITVTWNATGNQSVSVNYTNSNGCLAAAPTIFNVTVQAAPSPTITGPSNMCVNSGFFDYITQIGATGYVWTISPGGTITFGQGTNQAQATWNAPGVQWIAVNYTNANGCSAAVPVQYAVTVNPLPGPAQTVTGTATVCGGTTGVAYSIPAVNNATTYVWSLPPGATIASGAGTNAITVNFAQNATAGVITAYGNNVCGNGILSPPFPVSVTPLPAPAGTITGLHSVCEGTSGITYTVLVIPNATGYTWSVPSGVTIISGSNTNAITVDIAPGTVSGNITVIGTNSCGNGTISPAFALTVNPVPAAAVITASGFTLTSSASAGNQWYFNGNPIPGAVNQTYTASVTGSYWSVVSLLGCSSDTSNHIYLVMTGTGNLSSVNEFNVYPNPNDGRFTVNMKGVQSGIYSIEVLNNIGVSIWDRRDISIIGNYDQVIDLGPIPDGIYTVLVRDGKERFIRKVMIRN